MRHRLLALARLADAPFRLHFPCFTSLYLLIVACDLYCFVRGLAASFTFLFTGFFIAYVLAFVYSLLLQRGHGKTAVFGLSLASFFLLLFFAIDLFSILIYGTSFNKDYAAAITNSNTEEISEFMDTYLSLPLIVGIILLTLLSAAGLLTLFRRRIPLRKTYRLLLLIVATTGGVLFFTHPDDKRSIYGKISFLLTPEYVPELHRVRLPARLDSIPQQLPRNIVLIVGESLTRHHCSLYGYDKPTNPRLGQLRDDGKLFVFSQAESPGTNTINSLKDVFTTYPECSGGGRWFESVMLTDILRTAGYRTFWISNQSKKGLFDNIIGRFADLCDEQHFAGNKFAGVNRHTCDGVVLDLLHPLLQQPRPVHNFYLFHLMGSHPDFNRRYPKQFARFTEKMYPDRPAHQRSKCAEYDNSVYYNDSVVSEIIARFKDRESIVFYFSDHALDLYQSSPDFYGHARIEERSAAFGRAIPFMVYVSPSYRSRFPRETEMIRRAVDEPINTGNFIYLLADLLHIGFEDERMHAPGLSPFRRDTTARQ